MSAARSHACVGLKHGALVSDDPGRMLGMWLAPIPPSLRPPAHDHAEPAEAAIGLIARCGVEGDEFAPGVLVEAAAPSVDLEREALAQDAVAVGCGDDAKIRIDQQHPGLVGGADTHALDDGAGLRLPVEMDRQYAGRLAI